MCGDEQTFDIFFGLPKDAVITTLEGSMMKERTTLRRVTLQTFRVAILRRSRLARMPPMCRPSAAHMPLTRRSLARGRSARVYRVRPTVAQVCSVGLMWANLARCGPRLGKLLPEIDQPQPSLAKLWPSLAQLAPNTTYTVQPRANIGQVGHNFSPLLADAGERDEDKAGRRRCRTRMARPGALGGRPTE